MSGKLVKICGFTRRKDLLAAVEAKVDYVGVVAVPGSLREVDPATARALFADVRGAVRVLVVADLPLPKLQEWIDFVSPDVVQLHGKEPPEYAKALRGVAVWKACHLKTVDDVREMANFPAEMLVADSASGGSGARSNWTLAAMLAQERRIFIAGGITVDNAQSALEETAAAGIDTASGVEFSPGIKSIEKMQNLIGRIKP
ncbi:MAG: phosphoribosylanthranilate isomerase [Victivallaceae bacterium]|nr:phosphoribosylanthranilate isomerase [Victivallaceae bacterium]